MLAPDASQHDYGWFIVTRRGQKIRSSAEFDDFKRLSLYPRGSIHPVIEQETYSEFLRGDYETAIFKAFKAIEVRVRKAGGFPKDLIGKNLMVKAFHAARCAIQMR